jgi:hypothetical protein
MFTIELFEPGLLVPELVTIPCMLKSKTTKATR